MKNKLTHLSLGLVSRRMVLIGMIVALTVSFVLLLIFFSFVMGSKSTDQLKQTLPALAFALGIAFALVAGIYAYLCFSTLHDVMETVCGLPHLDYQTTDIFKVNNIHLEICLDDDDNWVCVCDCDVYHFIGNMQIGTDSSEKEPRYRMQCTRQRIMLCFPSDNALEEFTEAFETYEYNYWRNDGTGNLEKCERPSLAHLSLMASA